MRPEQRAKRERHQDRREGAVAGESVGGSGEPVAVRLGPEAKAALDVLAQRYGGRRRAIEAALLSMMDDRELLDRLDRIEAQVSRSGGAPSGSRSAWRQVLRQ